MSALGERLRAAAGERGLLAADADISPARAFALVSDMPYRRASSRRPESIIDEWRGTCSGKHYLLHELFTELKLTSRLCLATHVFDQAATRKFPWVDATSPRSARRLGESMPLACTPIETVEIPAGAEPQVVKEALIARHCAGHVERRERFIEALGAWLAGA